MLGCSAWKTPRYAKETSLNLVLSNSLMFACYWPQDCFSVSQVAAERLLMQTLEELRRPKPDEHKAWHKPDMVCDVCDMLCISLQSGPRLIHDWDRRFRALLCDTRTWQCALPRSAKPFQLRGSKRFLMQWGCDD